MKRTCRLWAWILAFSMLVSNISVPVYASGTNQNIPVESVAETETMSEETESEGEVLSSVVESTEDSVEEQSVHEETTAEESSVTEETSSVESDTMEESVTESETTVETIDELETATEEDVLAENTDENIVTATSSLKKIDFVERAKNNRVYMHESSGCSIASIASVESYVVNKGLTEEEQKLVYYEVKSKNGNSLVAKWSELGYKAVSVNGDYNLLYQKLDETGSPVIVHRSTGSGHYSLVVGYEDINNNSIPEANEFIVMESQKYKRIYDSKIGYPTSWDDIYSNGSKIPLDEWQVYVGVKDKKIITSPSTVIDQIVYRTTGMTLTSIKDEPADKLSIETTKPEGTLVKGSTFTISGNAKSNYKIQSVIAGVYKGETPAFTGYRNNNIDRYNYSWGVYSDLDNAMKFASLTEGDYTFRLMVTDENPLQSLL